MSGPRRSVIEVFHIFIMVKLNKNNKPITKRESSGAHAQTQNNIPQTQVG
jgi:hypothetical protein